MQEAGQHFGAEAQFNEHGRISMNSSVQHSPAKTRVQQLLPLGALALASSLWGTGFLFGKLAMKEMTVSENICFRFLTAAILLLPIVIRTWRPYRGKELGLLLVVSGMGVPVQFLIQFQGLRLTTVSHASLIVGVLPVMLAVGSSLVLRERLSAVEWMALFASALGGLLIGVSSRAGDGAGPTLLGDLLVLLSMFAAVVMILYSKRLIATHGALHVTATTITMGTALLLTWVELTGHLRFHFSPSTWMFATAQGLLATFGAYLFWNWGLTHMPAARAGVFLNLEPVVGTILGVAILHERLSAMGSLGGVLIIGAAVYFSFLPQGSQSSVTPT